MIIESLRKALIESLLKKRKIMKRNGSNCADIDAKLKYFGYTEELRSEVVK